MYYILALLADVGITASFTINKFYRTLVPFSVSSITFKVAVGSCVSFLLFFIIGGFKLQVNVFTLFMAVLMNVVAILSEVVTFTAYGKGHLSLYTVFQMQGGMLLPFVYGVVYGNRLTIIHVVGISIMMIALMMSVLPQRGRGEKPSGSYIMLCCLIFFLNGSISIISYIYSNSTSGTGPQNFIMIKSLMLGALALGLYLYFPKNAAVKGTGKGTPLRLGALIAGVSLVDSASYFAQLVSAARLPAVVMYPVITGGTMVLTAISGRLFFREKQTRMAKVGLALSFIATLLFAIDI